MLLALLFLFASAASADVIHAPGGFQEIRVVNARSRVVEGCLILAGATGRMLRVTERARVAEVIWLPVACPSHQPAALRELRAPIHELIYDPTPD